MSSSPNSSSSSNVAPAVPAGPAWLMDVPCRVDVVLGSTRVSMRECLQFDRGTVIALDQAAGADLELRVAGEPLATAEVVVVDDRTGLRVSRILPPAPADRP